MLAKSFTVPVEPVSKPAAEVTTSQTPFFDLGASTSSLARPASSSSPSLVQATGEGVDEMQTATKPLEAPGAGTATQPVQAPGSVPDGQPSSTGDVDLSAASDSEDDQRSFTGSLSDGNFRDQSPDRDLTREESADQEVSEEAGYSEKSRGVRSFMGWHKVPEFKTVSSSDDNFLPVHVLSQPVKCQSSSRWMTGYAERWTSLTSLSQKGTLQEILTLLASSRTGSSSDPGHPDGMGCMLRTMRVTQYPPGHLNRPNSTMPSVELQDKVFLLPHPPGPSARTCSGVRREQHVNKLLCAIRLLVYQGV